MMNQCARICSVSEFHTSKLLYNIGYIFSFLESRKRLTEEMPKHEDIVSIFCGRCRLYVLKVKPSYLFVIDYPSLDMYKINLSKIALIRPPQSLNHICPFRNGLFISFSFHSRNSQNPNVEKFNFLF